MHLYGEERVYANASFFSKEKQLTCSFGSALAGYPFPLLQAWMGAERLCSHPGTSGTDGLRRL